MANEDKTERELGALVAACRKLRDAFAARVPEMAVRVEQRLAGPPDGLDPDRAAAAADVRDSMRHGEVMAAVLTLDLAALLPRVLGWEARVYRVRGMDEAWMRAELDAWRAAAAAALEGDVGPLVELYDALIARVPDWFEAGAAPQRRWPVSADRPGGLGGEVAEAILAGNARRYLDLAEKATADIARLEDFYLDALTPAMYHVGALWEDGSLSVAQEHLATSIVSRAMAAAYLRFPLGEATSGRAVVTSGPGEHHELGGRMVADLLELDGWDVVFLGADTPTEDLVSLAVEARPDVIALSITMPQNLPAARKTIEALRAEPETRPLGILVGGLAVAGVPDACERLGADACASSGREARALAARLHGREHG